MNYNHIYHAGNFADVLKHVILVAVLSQLQKNKKPFFTLDTHSGRGRYNLASQEAERSGEFHYGIGRIYPLTHHCDFLKQYCDIVEKFNHNGLLRIYPGSPAIIEYMLRPHDRAVFCELNEKEFFKLHALLYNNKQVKTIRGDGYEALLSCLPPKEKHGLVLIDPPFEKKDEIITLETAIITSLKRWTSGTFMLWYPIKERAIFDTHYQRLKYATQDNNHKIQIFELTLPPHLKKRPEALSQTAVVLINPPEGFSDYEKDILSLGDVMFAQDFSSMQVIGQ